MRRFVVGLALATAMLAVPTWAAAGDQEIANELVKQLQSKKQSGELKQFGIDLEIDHGVVWLKGHVASAKHRDLVLKLAKSIDGVEEVIDDITIRKAQTPTTTTKAKKSSLLNTAALLTGLRKSEPAPRQSKPAATPKPTHVAPAVETLQGVAGRETLPVAQAEHMVAPASPAPTHRVHHRQPVATRPSDEEIAQEVIGRLRQQQQSGALRNFTLDVTVDAGSVWVKGTVASPQQQHLVLEVARRVYGVTQVVNDITVQQVALASQPIQAEPIANVDSRLKAARLQSVAQPPQQLRQAPANQMPVAFAPAAGAQPVAMNAASGIARARFDHPTMPGYAWPSYAAYPNYGAVTYPKQYSPAAWPYIGPFYPYPQVPLGWRKVTLQWDDGWWFLDFKSK